eukprot:scaffold33784_cov60-Cyclotella_meneghiniana.AAC.3
MGSRARVTDHNKGGFMTSSPCQHYVLGILCSSTPLYEDLPISSATAVERSEGLRTSREHFI